MENENQQEAVNQIYQFAANLLVNENKSITETKNVLISKGLDEESALAVVRRLGQQIEDAKKEGAKKDILYGALWCVGGIVATAANFGYVFWGAIVFGGVQLIKGLINLTK